MITPRFSLTQDDTFLTVNIRAPYCSLKDLEIFVEGKDFRFICNPYYLRLNLPGKIVENDNSSGQFLSELGEFILKYEKQTKGEHFEGLDLITTLLAPVKREIRQAGIQVLASRSDPNQATCSHDGHQWFVEQSIPQQKIDFTNNCKYGFACQKSGILDNIEFEFHSVFQVRNANKMSIYDRRHMRHDTESMDFSEDHYLSDYFEDEIIKMIVKLPSPWKKLMREPISFRNEERDILKDLPNKEYLLTEEERKFVMYSLVDILFGYCYDRRTTDFEGNCESGWTITRMSATLSWFEQFDNAHQLIATNFRRSLIYPLYRNLDLCNVVFEDLKQVLVLGNVCIVKCLIDIYNTFNASSEPRYILNELYIKDYLIFMQKCTKSHLNEIIQELNEVRVSIRDMQLNLDVIIERVVRASMKRDDLLEKMSRLRLSRQNTDSESSSSSDSSSESEDSSSSSSDDSEN